MSLSHSPKIVTDGLVFAYDMANTQKSWKGHATTNHAYGQNARTDASYVSYADAVATGTWTAKHADAIRAYNFQGADITGYINSGVGDYTNTYHATWTLDPILKKPVVVMRDFDAAWKAKSFGLSPGNTPTAMGVGYGDLYTISWLQWTDNIAKSANAGLYGVNLSAAAGFHDGLSQSAYDSSRAFNTLPFTWQRVWATFQVNAVRDLAAGWSCYMYGHYNTRNTIKIADVQVETGYVSGFLENGASTRSTTEAIVDLTNKNTVTSTSLTYASDGSFSFDGTSNRLSQATPDLPTGTGNKTILTWVWPDSTGPANQYTGLVVYGGRSSSTPSDAVGLSLYTSGTTMYVSSAYWSNDFTPNNLPVTANSWNMVGMIARGAPTTNNTTLICGNASGVNYVTGSSSNYARGLSTTSVNLTIGCLDAAGGRYMKGKISQVMIFNRELSTDEISQMFNAHRGRYGL